MIAHHRNATTRGTGFDLRTVDAVQRAASAVPNNDPAVWRKDRCGAWIKRVDYGRTTQYGWEIDHVKPVVRGGADNLGNLQALQWENNRHKGDSWPSWSCAITAHGTANSRG